MYVYIYLAVLMCICIWHTYICMYISPGLFFSFTLLLVVALGSSVAVCGLSSCGSTWSLVAPRHVES